MAVGIVMEFEGGALEQYDEALERMELRPGGAGPPGILFHVCHETGEGFRVIDVWEDRETFDSFARAQIMPLTQEVGMTEPRIEFFDVHSHLTAGERVERGERLERGDRART